MILTLQHIMHCGMMFFSASLPRSAAEFEAELAPAARRFLAPGPTVGRHQNGASHAPPEGRPFRWKIFEKKNYRKANKSIMIVVLIYPMEKVHHQTSRKNARKTISTPKSHQTSPRRRSFEKTTETTSMAVGAVGLGLEKRDGKSKIYVKNIEKRSNSQNDGSN